MKRLLTLVIAVLLCCSLMLFTACEQNQGGQSGSNVQGSSDVNNGGNSVGDNTGNNGGNTGNNGGDAGNNGGNNGNNGGNTGNNGGNTGNNSSSSTGGNNGGNTGNGGGNSTSTDNGTNGGNYPEAVSGDIYLSPQGNDSNQGTISSPLYSLSVAVSRAKAGTTIFMLPGTYSYNARINLTASGTENEPITIQAKDWGEVVLDFTNQKYGRNDSAYVGLYLSGNYWKIQGITICHAGDNGIKVEGSYNYIGRCITHHCGDTGIQLGFGHTTSNPNGLMCAYNTIENCDSYLNYDFDNHGDADGFACKMHNGKGNVFRGCRAWRNCDDAWDLYETDWSVVLEDCWAWESGNKTDFSNDQYFSDPNYLSKKGVSKPSAAGNGNGIKLGGNGSGGSSKGTHYAINCVAFGSDITGSVKGFDENSHGDGVVLRNCVAWDNGYNYMFENGGAKTEFTGCVSFYTGKGTQKPNRLVGEVGGKPTMTNNNFFLDGGDLVMNKTVTADDFITIAEEDAKAPRQSDGSLPNNGFAKFKSTSQYYGSGMGLK